MLSPRVNTLLVVLTAFLWVLTAGLGWAGYGYPGMFIGVVILTIYMIQGVARRGRVSRRFIVFPLFPWFLFWCGSFWLSRYYADLYQGRVPDFTILGFHPSFAWTVLTYWIGGVLTLTVGFVFLKDEWLTEQDWAEFKDKVTGSSDTAEDEP